MKHTHFPRKPLNPVALFNRLVFLALVVFFATSCARWSKNGSQTRSQTQIIEFSAPWCRACSVFERQVLDDEQVKKKLTNFKFTQYNIETKEGQHHKKRLGVSLIPSVVALNKDGEVVEKIIGRSKYEFLNFLRRHQ